MSMEQNSPRMFVVVMFFVFVWIQATTLRPQTLSAQQPAVQVSQPDVQNAVVVDTFDAEQQAKSTAIALNYCRAAFHRIRKYPTVEVLTEEQDQILNNLNMQGIADPEVIRLYSEVLDEISRNSLRGREVDLYSRKYKGAIFKGAALEAVSFMLQVASAQYVSAIKTGANGFWDYRNQTLTRETEMLRLDKEYVTSVVQKSSMFLDTLWKLSQKRQIPDRYLVRGTDLDKLEEASKIEDLNARLRVLARMENYMTCYPPYWYYVARTQQALGKFEEAATTYATLENFGKGYFRRDEMLAAGIANLALIQHHQGKPEAIQTAKRALEYTSDVWQANLIVAKVLMDRKESIAAEDALFRNLDVDLESEQSLASLVILYDISGQKEKLMLKLAEQKTLETVPAAILVKAAQKLSTNEKPLAYQNWLANSLRVTPQKSFTGTEIIVQASPNWFLEKGTLTLTQGNRKTTGQYLTSGRGGGVVKFPSSQDWLASYQSVPNDNVSLKISFPAFEPLSLSLRDVGTTNLASTLSNGPYQIADVNFEQAPATLENQLASQSSTPTVESSPEPLPYAVMFDVRPLTVAESNQQQDLNVSIEVQTGD